MKPRLAGQIPYKYIKRRFSLRNAENNNKQTDKRALAENGVNTKKREQ